MTRTDYFLIAWVFVLGAYILFAALCLPPEQTVSSRLYVVSQAQPIIPFLIGFGIGVFFGHVFWGE